METITIKTAKVGSKKNEKEILRSENSEIIRGLRNLFVDELNEIYWSETAIKKTIHKMLKHTSSDELMNELTKHLEAVKQHQLLLEEVFQNIGEKLEVVKSKGIEGLIKEVEATMAETKKGILRDAGIISAALKIKHYGIATYGMLCFYARALGETDAAVLLHTTLVQEKEANEKLSQIIESMKVEMV